MLSFIDPDFLQNYQAQHTRTSYLNDLNQFVAFIHDKFPETTLWTAISRQHIISFRNYLQECEGRTHPDLAPKTIGRKLAAISSFFDFAIEKYGAPEINPTSSVKRPRRQSREPTEHLNLQEITDLLRAVDDEGAMVRPLHRALIVTLFLTGLRKSEVIGLKKQDYLVREGVSCLRVKAKGSKYLWKALHPEAINAIDEYLEWMKGVGREHTPQDWLFQPTINRANPNNLEKALNPRTLNRIMEKYAKKAGIHSSVSPHSARASFITQLLEQGVEISAVAKEVGHASVTTTQEYDRRLQGNGNQIILNFNKRSQILKNE